MGALRDPLSRPQAGGAVGRPQAAHHQQQGVRDPVADAGEGRGLRLLDRQPRLHLQGLMKAAGRGAAAAAHAAAPELRKTKTKTKTAGWMASLLAGLATALSAAV